MITINARTRSGHRWLNEVLTVDKEAFTQLCRNFLNMELNA